MPHASFKIKPGVDQNETAALNEAGISTSNLIRFIYDRSLGALVQKLGGWTKYYPNKINAIVRALWAWEDTDANSYLAYGTQLVPATTHAQLAVINSNVLTDITPRYSADDITPAASTTAGTNRVVITDNTTVDVTQYDTAYIQTHISVGGIVLFGQYACDSDNYLSTNSYTIYATNVLGLPNPATSTSTVATLPAYQTTNASNIVQVTLINHGYSVGSTYPVLVSTTINGITLYGNYIVQTIIDSNNFTIYASTTASASTTNLTTTGTSGTGTTATISFATQPSAPAVGSVVVVTGVVPSGYNGTYVVTSSTTSSVSYASTTTGSQTTAGKVSIPTPLNSNKAHIVYYYGIGAIPAGTGFGIGAFGSGGFGTGSAISPTTGSQIPANNWTLDNWGEILISVALNGTLQQPIYQWDPLSGSPTATVIPNAPPLNDGAFVAMPQRQIIAWGSTFTGIQDPLLIRWCDVNNFNSWIALTTNQAGSYRIPKGSKIVGCIQGPQQALVWTDLGVWSMQYIGPPYVYSFNEIGSNCGLISRKAATSFNGVVYWMGPSQFFSLQGSGVTPVACPIWDVIFQDLDTTNLDKIRVAVNSRFGEITWYYPTISDGGEVNAYAKYNAYLNVWDYGSIGRTAWIDQSVLGPPIGFDPSQMYIYQHETSNDADGQPLLASFQTGYMAMNEADLKTFVDQVWPDMKWGFYGGTQSATVNLTFYVTDYAGQTPIAYGPYPLTQGTQFISPRFRGRLVSIGLNSNDIGSFWRLGNMRYRMQQDGKF
jgi:hypothetical protein